MRPEISNLLGVAITALTPFIVAALVAVTMKLWKLLGLKATETDKANMEQDIAAAIGVGVRVVLPQIMRRGTSALSDPAMLSAIVKEATAYLQERFPDRAAQIIANAPDQMSEVEAIRQTIGARLPNVISQIAPQAALGAASDAVLMSPAASAQAGPSDGPLPLGKSGVLPM